MWGTGLFFQLLWKSKITGDSQVIQCLGLHAFTAKGKDLLPGWGTKEPTNLTAQPKIMYYLILLSKLTELYNTTQF